MWQNTFVYNFANGELFGKFILRTCAPVNFQDYAGSFAEIEKMKPPGAGVIAGFWSIISLIPGAPLLGTPNGAAPTMYALNSR